MRKMILLGIATVALSGLAMTSGCSLQDNICSGGEYPAIAIGGQGGGACFRNGHEPTAPYVRYPKGKVPQHVDDKWDIYWRSHGIDENGHTFKIG